MARINRDAIALTDTAEAIGEESVTRDLGLISAWLDQQAGGEREPSTFGPISTEDLVTTVLLNPSATDDQLARAAREMRLRLLRDNRVEVEMRAERALMA